MYFPKLKGTQGHSVCHSLSMTNHHQPGLLAGQLWGPRAYFQAVCMGLSASLSLSAVAAPQHPPSELLYAQEITVASC